jgi:hypothetical protein
MVEKYQKCTPLGKVMLSSGRRLYGLDFEMQRRGWENPTIADLEGIEEAALQRIPNMGRKSVSALIHLCDSLGVKIRQNQPYPPPPPSKAAVKRAIIKRLLQDDHISQVEAQILGQKP